MCTIKTAVNVSIVKQLILSHAMQCSSRQICERMGSWGHWVKGDSQAVSMRNSKQLATHTHTHTHVYLAI